MRVIIQRVSEASVSVESQIVGRIDKGLLVLIGFSPIDNQQTMAYIIDKIIGLRIFEDPQGKMNLSVKDLAGGILLVPNFTLYADCRKGKRPSFIGAAKPEEAKAMFEEFTSLAKASYDQIACGVFQADMQVALVNDGPVTVIIDSDDVGNKKS